MNYLVIEEYKGKNFINQEIIIPADTAVERVGDLIYFKGTPFCTWKSQVAKDYLVWNDDGCAADRKYYESIILFSPRMRRWKESIPIYNEFDIKIGEKEIIQEGRFSPNEIKYIKMRFPQFVKNEAGLSFNDFFYCGSNIEDIRELAVYLQK